MTERDGFIATLRSALNSAPARKPYYPGSDVRPKSGLTRPVSRWLKD